MARKSNGGRGFKMKGHTLPGINQKSETKNMADGRSKSSTFQKKPTKEELFQAANDPNHPRHRSKFDTVEEYYAWKGGSEIAPKAKQREDIYHAEGGKLRRFSDDTVDVEATEENIASVFPKKYKMKK